MIIILMMGFVLFAGYCLVRLRRLEKALGSSEGKYRTLLKTFIDFKKTVPDINKLTLVEEKLCRRIDYERGLSKCIALLSGFDDLDGQLSRVTSILQSLVKVSRTYIFVNKETPESGLCMTRIHESCAHGILPQINDPELNNLSYRDFAPGLLSLLQAGKTYAHVVSEMVDSEQERLLKQGIVSILILPIYAGEHFWGYIGFDDCETPRQWKKEDIEILGAIAHAMGSAILRWESVEALRKSEERFSMVISVANEGIWDWNLRTNEIFFDDCYYTVAGYEPGEFPGLFDEWKKRVHPDDLDKTEDAIKQYLAGNKSAFKAVFRFIKKDKTWMWIMGKGKIVAHDKEGRPIRFVGTHSDITDLKLTEKALRRAQKMEAVGQLTGGISHDFNNMLSIIIGNLDLLKLQVVGNQKANKRITAARKSAIRAADLTKQLLGFSRREAEHVAATNINTLIQGMESLIKRSLTPEVVVEYKFEENLWLTGIDIGSFEDALLNLVLNARDAMEGCGRLIIETSNTRLDLSLCTSVSKAFPGEYVQLIVRDSGKGIPADELDRIFEPFFTTKPQGKGTGLGLSMVFGFVESSGGEINTYSEPGIGTTFSLYLPRGDGEKLQPELPVDLSVALSRGCENILVVDDEEDLLDLVRTTLESIGYRVVTALDGHEAMARLAEEPTFDLLFSDIVMPGGINGYDLAREACLRYPNLKVLLTSGYAPNSITISSFAQFNSDLLKKPYTQVDMAQRVRTLLDDGHPCHHICLKNISSTEDPVGEKNI